MEKSLQLKLYNYELQERWQLMQIFTRLNRTNKKYRYELHISNTGGCPYDAFVFIKSKKTDKTIAKYFIEMKNRTHDWEDFILEKRKLTSLQKERKHHQDWGILYINSTPTKTLIWDLDDESIYSKKINKRKMNSATFESRKEENKRNKMIWDLKVEDAIVIKMPFLLNNFKTYLIEKAKPLEKLNPIILKEKKIITLF